MWLARVHGTKIHFLFVDTPPGFGSKMDAKFALLAGDGRRRPELYQRTCTFLMRV